MTTQADIEAQAFQARLAEEGAASLTAYAMLMRALELPTNTPLEESTQAMVELGLAPSEVVDWLAACEYDESCFRQEMFLQLAEARERKRAATAMTIVGIGAVVAIGLGVMAWRRR